MATTYRLSQVGCQNTARRWSFYALEEFKSPRSILNNINSLAISPISNSGTTASQLSQKGDFDATCSTASLLTLHDGKLAPRQARKQANPMRFKVRLFNGSVLDQQASGDGMEGVTFSPEESSNGSTSNNDLDPFLHLGQEGLDDCVFQVLDDGYCSSPVTSPSRTSNSNQEEALTAMQCIIDYVDCEYPLQCVSSVQYPNNAHTPDHEVLKYCLSSEGMEDLKDSEGKSKPTVFTRADNWIATCRVSPPRHQRPPTHLSGSISDPSHLRLNSFCNNAPDIKPDPDEQHVAPTSKTKNASKNPLRKSSRAQRLHFSSDYEYEDIRTSRSPKRVVYSPSSPDGNDDKENIYPCCNGRIKRPRNAFILYTIEHRASVARLYPNTDNREISKLLGEQWKSLSEKDKLPYRQAANKEMAELRYRYPNWKYSANRGQDVVSNGAMTSRQKRRRYNKKVPAKPMGLKEMYMKELANTVKQESLFDERNSQFIHGGEHSLSASEASSTTGEPLEMYSWLQCENCKKWRRTATDSYELEGDASCYLLGMDCECTYNHCSSPGAYRWPMSAKDSE